MQVSIKTLQPANIQREAASPASGLKQPAATPFWGKPAAQPFFQPTIQRKCAHCEEEEKKSNVQRKEASPAAISPTAVESNINSTKGQGEGLKGDTLHEMNGAFGADFSSVKIHTGNNAAGLNRQLNAQAFTTGNDIYFNEGKYAPGSSSGKHLLAHELTHTLQQGQGTTGIARQVAPVKEHGDLSQVPAGLACPVDTTAPRVEDSYPFTVSSSGLSPANQRLISGFAANWHRLGASATVRIDGFASVDGSDAFNWGLSCQRAQAVRDEMITPSDSSPGIGAGFISIFAHGETNHFSRTDPVANRVAVISSVVPVPPPPPPGPTPPTPPVAPERKCGPNVTTEIARVWAQVQSNFNSWGFTDKLNACRYLIQPVIVGSGGPELNKDAFDTFGLFLNTAGWTQRGPYHPPCGVPGSTGDPCWARDPLHEADDVCSNTVQTGSGCWKSGTVNYGTYGVMMRLCNGFISPIGFLPPPFGMLSGAFSYASMVALITAYKLYDRENPMDPIAWASATYNGGPSGVPSGGNKPNCPATCNVPFTTPSFDYVWEPVRQRSSLSGAPYAYPCTTAP